VPWYEALDLFIAYQAAEKNSDVTTNQVASTEEIWWQGISAEEV